LKFQAKILVFSPPALLNFYQWFVVTLNGFKVVLNVNQASRQNRILYVEQKIDFWLSQNIFESVDLIKN